MNLFRTIKPVVKHGVIFARKWDSLKDSQNFGIVCFAKKQGFKDKFNKKSIKSPIHYKIPCMYLKSITNIEKIKNLIISWFDFLIYFLQYLQHIYTSHMQN